MKFEEIRNIPIYIDQSNIFYRNKYLMLKFYNSFEEIECYYKIFEAYFDKMFLYILNIFVHFADSSYIYKLLKFYTFHSGILKLS